jgi:hypothetical protein
MTTADQGAVPTAARTLNLTAQETVLLERILHGYLGDLRMEIVATDRPSMRRDLREEEAQVRSLIDRLT